jgi:hypothetical protein
MTGRWDYDALIQWLGELRSLLETLGRIAERHPIIASRSLCPGHSTDHEDPNLRWLWPLSGRPAASELEAGGRALLAVH